LETSLESNSVEPLIDFLAFLVQKLWLKNNKLIILCYFNPSNKSSKVSKNSDFSLVSNENFSEKLPSSGYHSGPHKVGQKNWNYSTYDNTHK